MLLFLEYFSLQAPKGEEGMYLGFSHLHSFLSSIFGFGLSGFLLSKYCPARELLVARPIGWLPLQMRITSGITLRQSVWLQQLLCLFLQKSLISSIKRRKLTSDCFLFYVYLPTICHKSCRQFALKRKE